MGASGTGRTWPHCAVGRQLTPLSLPSAVGKGAGWLLLHCFVGTLLPPLPLPPVMAPDLYERRLFPLQVTTAVVVVVIDLSDPASVLSTTQYWIDQVR